MRGCNPFPARTEVWRSLLAVALLPLYNSISGGWGIAMSKGVRVIGPDRAQLRRDLVDLESELPDDHRAAGLGFCPRFGRGRVLRSDQSARRDRRPATDPQVVLAVWLYATMEGIGSARAIDRLCQKHAAYRQINDTSPPKPGFAPNVASGPALQRSEPSMLRCRARRPQRRAAFHRASPVASRRPESLKPATRYSACPQRRNRVICGDVRWRRAQPGAAAPAS